MGSIIGDQLFQRVDRQVGPASKILVEVRFELVLQHRALRAWERLKIREGSWVDKHRTPIPHDVEKGIDHAIGMLVDAEILSHDADPRPLQTVRIQKLSVIRQAMVLALPRGRISRVHTGQGTQHRGGIGDGAADGPHRILRVRDRDDPRPTRQSNGRLDPNHAADRRWAHDRAIGLGSQRRRGQIG